MRLEWDEDKRRVNVAKHGLDFIDGAEIFDAPMLAATDTRHDYGEDRTIGIGACVGSSSWSCTPSRHPTRCGSSPSARRSVMKEDASRPISATDWARVGALGDADIDTTDIPPLDDSFFDRAELRPGAQAALVEVTVHLDPEVLAWFRRRGDDYERAINAALRIYAEAHSR